VATFCRLAASRFPVTLYLPHKPQGVTMLDLMTAYPTHKQEILAGYKLYELGKGEYEAYYIFKEYCLSVMTGA
jgi:hypothetical protein